MHHQGGIYERKRKLVGSRIHSDFRRLCNWNRNGWKFLTWLGREAAVHSYFYLIFLLMLGLPIMTMEFAVGRASQKSPVKAYYALGETRQKWHIHGYITLIGCYLLMMFYTTVSGWMLHYFYLTATGKFTDLIPRQYPNSLTRCSVSRSLEGILDGICRYRQYFSMFH